jgi:hypothetical protein
LNLRGYSLLDSGAFRAYKKITLGLGILAVLQLETSEYMYHIIIMWT